MSDYRIKINYYVNGELTHTTVPAADISMETIKEAVKRFNETHPEANGNAQHEGWTLVSQTSNYIPCPWKSALKRKEEKELPESVYLPRDDESDRSEEEEMAAEAMAYTNGLSDVCSDNEAEARTRWANLMDRQG